MAEFISGADLVARGAEGTGAATVLNNQPTIQNLARLGGRMDNLYKTQEMLKLKLAAAKQEKEKEPKQPNLNQFATTGIISDLAQQRATQIMLGANDVYRVQYDKNVSSNNISSANQNAADAASTTALISTTAKNLDESSKNYLERNKSFYTPTADFVRDVQSNIPSIDEKELSAIPDENGKQKYFLRKAREFASIDPQAILTKATLYNPRTYNYNGVLEEVQARLKDKSIKVQNADGTGFASDKSELLKKDGGLDYDRAAMAVEQLPVAKQQMQFLMYRDGEDVKTTEAYKLKNEKEKEQAVANAQQKARNEYIARVFPIGLKSDTERDYQSTQAAAAQKTEGEKPKDKVYSGPFNFNYQGSVFSYDKAKNRVQRPVDYTIESEGAAVADEKWTVPPNSVFVPLGQLSSNDVTALRAQKFKSRIPNAVNNLWVQNTAGETQSAARVKMPMFVNSYTDPDDPSINYNAGDFVPKDLLAKKTRYPSGEEVRVLDPDNYMLVTGHVANPKVKIEIGKDAMLNPIYDEQATTQNFYMDQSSFQTLQKEIERREKKKGTIFSGFSRGK
jgi:hypothetical protein